MTSNGSEMRFPGYNKLLNQCISRKAIREGQRVHSRVIKSRYLPPLYLRNRLIILYSKCECSYFTGHVFDKMSETDVSFLDCNLVFIYFNVLSWSWTSVEKQRIETETKIL